MGKSVEDSDFNDEKNLKNKKIKTNYVPKESSLSSDEIKLAKIISQIRSKYEYNTHNMPCYIEDQNHLQLTPLLLHLWVQDMNAGGATVEVLPSYPVFGIAYAIKVNKQLNISQPTSSISDSVPTFYKFFKKLNKAYNDGNDNYLKLEVVFAREKLTVNGIKDLNDEYLKEELRITKCE
ncbi:12397_t:CDS:2 [Racocetra persica]|uniref:12397_t:CDS:1 n=1 Tax=Racocetra persica TaxID=160502 RepID=A0ACA9KIY7_9GLOM|nr:12397_t:CDS:2 [Racocetra persica]